MPIPVSDTEKARPAPAPGTCEVSRRIRSCTRPCWVNLTALDSRLCSTCRSRCRSVTTSAGTSGADATANSSLFSAASGSNTVRRSSASDPSANGSGCTSSLPASTRDRSRMSLISSSRSDPDEWITLAYSTCLGDRFAAGFSASSRARMSRLFSGVRSSCETFARNCDLYREARSSCLARSSISCPACSISAFLISMSRFCWASCAALSSSSALELCSSSCRACSSPVLDWSSAASRWDSCSR